MNNEAPQALQVLQCRDMNAVCTNNGVCCAVWSHFRRSHQERDASSEHLCGFWMEAKSLFPVPSPRPQRMAHLLPPHWTSLAQLLEQRGGRLPLAVVVADLVEVDGVDELVAALVLFRSAQHCVEVWLAVVIVVDHRRRRDPGRCGPQ
eukprot:gene12697-biopygen9512